MLQASAQPLLRKLEWRVRHAADAGLSGEYRSAFRGRGREFDQVVRYEWGDDVRDIDWNVTARLGEPYRKKFVEERELTLAVLIEDSDALAFGSGQRTKRDVLLEMAGLFALLAASNRDRVGFWHAHTSGDVVHRPKRGRSQILRETAEVMGSAAAEPSVHRADPVIDWSRFAHVFPRHAVVVWLGDFAPGEMPARWRAMRRRFDVIGVRVDDPWERELPSRGRLTVVDPVAGELLPFDPASSRTRRRHAEWVAARDRHFDDLFPSELQQIRLTTEDDPVEVLVRFMRQRMRMMVA